MKDRFTSSPDDPDIPDIPDIPDAQNAPNTPDTPVAGNDRGSIAEGIIARYYPQGSDAGYVLRRHGMLVAEAALAIARRVAGPDPDRSFMRFIGEAALLHDIGIFRTRAPAIGCTGSHPYVCHGYLGRIILEEHGLPAHALVCERHVGAGLTAADIREMNLPVPVRDMLPQTLAEEIVCFADCFFSKTPAPEGTRHSTEDVIAMLAVYGHEKTARFCGWLDRFGPPPQTSSG